MRERRLTEEDVIEADEALRRRMKAMRRIFEVVGLIALIVLIGITDPVHAWLHTHLQFLVGVFMGTLLEMIVWLAVDRRKRPNV